MMKPTLPLLLLLIVTASTAQAQQDAMQRRKAYFKWVNPPNEEDAWAKEAGIHHKTFYSESNKADVGYFIRFPRDYDSAENLSRSFPVLYYLKAGRGSGDERHSLPGFSHMLEFLNSADYPNVFMVGVNAGLYSHRDYGEHKGERAFLEFVDHVDSTYRTIQSREGRALLGYSFGAAPVARRLLKYPDQFLTGIALDGNYKREWKTQEQQGKEDSPIENWRNNAYTNATEYAARKDKPAIRLMVVVGDDSRNYPGTLEWVLHLLDHDIPHQLVVVPGIPHSGLGTGNGWQVEHTGERIYRFLAEGFAKAVDK